MNIEATVSIVIALIATSTGIFFSNVFERYEKKIVRIRTAIVGLLEQARDELVDNELKKRGQTQLSSKQEKSYDDFITYMKKSKFLKYANEHEELLSFEESGDRKINHLCLTIYGLVIPTFLLQEPSYIFIIGFLWFSLNLGFLFSIIINIIEMVKRINELYKEYVIGKQSFGGYD